MKKRVFAIVMSVCLLFTAFSCIASAADVEVAQTLPTAVRICPGTIIGEGTKGKLDAPAVGGYVYAQGWEIKEAGASDDTWIPYDGEPITLSGKATEATYEVRYYAAPFSSDASKYVYSNVSTVLVKHNPTGEYLYSGSYHWRVCADCGGKHGEALHSFLDSGTGGMTGGETACTVCGAHRTPQWTGLAAFFQWLFDTIFSFIG